MTVQGLVASRVGRNLRVLYLSGPRVADADLPRLRGLPRLEELGIRFAPVTDAGVEAFRDWAGLRRLTLLNTKVTATGFDAIRAAMPKVAVVGNP